MPVLKMKRCILVVFLIDILDRVFKIDDPVGAISVHGVVGLFGLLVVPLTNQDVLITGQLLGAATIFVWAFGCSMALRLSIKYAMGIRVSIKDGLEGIDISECGSEAYPEFSK